MKSKITSLTLGNFKAFGTTQSIPVRPITLIFGANSAGKSSILQSLVFAHEASKPSRRIGSSPLDVYKTELGGESIDLGGFDHYLHSAARGNPQGRVTFGLSVESCGVGTLGNPWYIPRTVEVQVQFGKAQSATDQQGATSAAMRICPVSLSIRVNGENLIAFDRDRNDLHYVSDLNTGSEIFQKIVGAAGELESSGRFESMDSFSPICEPLSKPNPAFSWRSEELRRDLVSCLEDGIRSDLKLSNHHEGLLTFEKWNLDLIWGRLADKPEVKAAVEYLMGLIESNVQMCAICLDDLKYLGPVRELADRVLLSAASENELGDKSRGRSEYNALMKSSLLLGLANRWLERLGTGLKLESNALIKQKDVLLASARPLEAFSLIASWKGAFKNPVEFDDSGPEELADVLRLMRTLAQNRFEEDELEDNRLKSQGGSRGQRGTGDPDLDFSSRILERFREISVSDEAREVSGVPGRVGETRGARFDHMCEQYFLYLALGWLQGYKMVVLRELTHSFAFLPSGSKSGVELRQLTLRDAQTSKELSFRDVGCGVAQCVPVIAMLTGAQEKIVCIEQPELHLHPKLQSEMGDLLIESALGGNGNTVIAETHSEHLILRILRRLRETAEGRLPEGGVPITPDHVAILYVEKEGGESKVRHIEVTRDGNFKSPWPGGFFEERLEELF